MAIINQHGNKLNWDNIIFLSVFHLGAVGALFVFTWQALFVSIFLWWLTMSLGIGVGYHRLLTHRGYKTPKAVEYFLTMCGALAFEGGPISWVATHRIHHAHTDDTGDPHSPREGGWWAHVGWILQGTAQQHEKAVLARYAPDLVKDRFYRWLDRLFWLPLVILAVALFAFGGWAYLLWAVCFRVTFGLHATWLVNSATHLWGSRRFETRDDSRNSMWVALLSFGEGWHNNHHAHPTAARHGLAWYEIDMNWWSIRTLQLLGLASSIKLIAATDRASESEILRVT
ncbi:MAG TPA: fatty acid desaturase [Pyrinomonadaceae bacterium]|jgi:stearoyl-CoA desaturase (delta-9 desaturase)